MGRFDNFIYLSVIIFSLMLLFFFYKNKQYRENFENVFHVTDAKDYQFDKIIVNPQDNNAEYDNDGLYLNKLYVTNENKLFVGSSSETETNFSPTDLVFINNYVFPYIKKTNVGERLQFHNYGGTYYLDANHLRALQGKQLVPLYNKSQGVNKYAMKIEAQPSLFETSALKCGFSKYKVNHQRSVTGFIPEDKSY